LFLSAGVFYFCTLSYGVDPAHGADAIIFLVDRSVKAGECGIAVKAVWMPLLSLRSSEEMYISNRPGRPDHPRQKKKVKKEMKNEKSHTMIKAIMTGHCATKG